MATILDRLSPEAQLGQMWGKTLGTSLQSLVENKAAQIKKQQGLSALFGPEIGKQLSYFPDQLLGKVMPAIFKNLGAMKDTSAEGRAYGEGIRASVGVEPGDSQISPDIPVTLPEKPRKALDMQPPLTEQQQKISAMPSGDTQIIPKSGAFAGRGIPSPDKIIDNLNKSTAFQTLSGEKQQKIIDSALKQRNEELKNALRARQIESRKGKETRQERKTLNTENRSDIRDFTKAYQDTTDNIARLKKMRNLIKTGKLGDPRAIAAATAIPGVKTKAIGWFSPETQEFYKVSNDMLRTAPSIFGSNMSGTSAELFLKMVPNINQSDDAKLAVIDDMLALAKKIDVRYKTMNSLLKKHGEARLPGTISNLVEEAASKKLEALQKKYIEGKKDYKKYRLKSIPATIREKYKTEPSDKELIENIKGLGSGVLSLFQ